MTYGIVFEKDDKTGFTYLKSKKVADVNIISVTRYVAFADAVLKAGGYRFAYWNSRILKWVMENTLDLL